MVATIMCVILIHFTGKRPLVLVSTIGIGVCLFGTATYAHYLKVVPGFAINNVVVNASSIVPKESIISQSNITDLFESEQKALLLTSEQKMRNYQSVDIEMTTLISTDLGLDKINPINRTVREIIYPYIEGNNSTNIDYDEDVSFTNLTSLEYDEDTNFYIDDENKTSKHHKGNEKITLDLPIQIEDKANKTVINEVSNDNDDSPLAKDILLTVPKQETNYLVWLPLILLLGSAFFAHLGIRMIPWILIGEVFPAPVRSTASGASGAVGYVFGFLANKFFLQMLTTLTLPGTFWFYSAVAFFGAITLYYILPETEGRTLYVSIIGSFLDF